MNAIVPLRWRPIGIRARPRFSRRFTVTNNESKPDPKRKAAKKQPYQRLPGPKINIFNPWLFRERPEIGEMIRAEVDDWGSQKEEDWMDAPDIDDEPEEMIDPRPRKGVNMVPRDSWMSPIFGFEGIVDRLAFDEESVEERISAEWTANQTESRQALRAIGFFIAVPLSIGFVISRGFAEPVFNFAESMDTKAFAPTHKQKADGGTRVQIEEMRIHMEEAVGHIKPMTEDEVYEHLSDKAHELAAEMVKENKQSLLNVISDTISGAVFFFLFTYMTEARRIVMQTVSRLLEGLSDSAKAFLIILVADIVLGYHSEEGWTALLNSISRHYGVEAEEAKVTIFVSVVPVFMDACFKYWVFTRLNRKSPGTAVTLRAMDRH